MAPLTPQERQWLAAISFAEGTYASGKGPQYNIRFGGGRFPSLASHPGGTVSSGGYTSGAAGAYQFMPGTWAGVSKKLGLKDFGPQAQDLAALQLIRQRGVDPRRDPITPQTVAKLSPEWASFPTASGKSYYGQPVKSFQQLQQFLAKEQGFLQTGAAANAAPGSVASAPANAAQRVQLPRFDLQNALKNVLLTSAVQGLGTPGSTAEALRLQSKADELEEAGYEEEADVLQSQSLSKLAESTQQFGLDPATLAKNILELRQKQIAYNTEASQIEKTLNDVAIGQTAQAAGLNTQTGAKPGQVFAHTGRGIAYPNAVVTSAVDATGEPGLDFSIAGGANAVFATPFNAQVLKVVREPNTANRGPGGRGYGNYVELRGVTPEGKPFDALIAHFNKLNPNLKPGMRLAAGTPLGLQGETGRATGPHISMDFYDPGATTASPDILRIRDIVADRIKKGKAPFG